MGITTNVTIDNTEGGFASIVSGLQSGDSSRQVSIQAFPANGFVFTRWEISTEPAFLRKFADVASIPVATIAEVCGTLEAPSTYQAIARELFTDGTMLYLDQEGRIPAPTGYWGVYGGTYYYWTGGRLPTLQTCTYGGGSSGGGGGSGGGQTSDELLRGTGGEFDQTVSATGIDDIRFT